MSISHDDIMNNIMGANKENALMSHAAMPDAAVGGQWRFAG